MDRASISDQIRETVYITDRADLIKSMLNGVAIGDSDGGDDHELLNDEQSVEKLLDMIDTTQEELFEVDHRKVSKRKKCKYVCKYMSMVNLDLGGFHHKRQMRYTTWCNFWTSLLGFSIILGLMMVNISDIGKPL